MDITITPSRLRGQIRIIPSKSMAHRFLILSAFADRPTEIFCPHTSQDIEATANCLRSLGASLDRTCSGYLVDPIVHFPKEAVLNCGESGSTLRFLLPIVAAMGVDTRFHMQGRLPQRPLSPLWEELERMGCTLAFESGNALRCTGRLQPGPYTMDGSVSSQFITGLLLALPLLDGPSTLTLTGRIESAPYIQMTLRALEAFGTSLSGDSTYSISPGRFHSPATVSVEGDWSNGAFWLAAAALGSEIQVSGLDPDSPQGDRAVLDHLKKLDTFCTIDASQTPDLIPVLAVVAAARDGAEFTNCARLRLKETDRLATTAAMIQALGGSARIQGDTLSVRGGGLTGGTVDATGDHRIAMAAAIASTVCTAPVTILGAESVNKSYPTFWDDFKFSGGKL